MRISAVFTLLFLTGCSGITPPQDFVYQEIKTPYFTLASWQKTSKISDSQRIYIEGDGNAFTSSGIPSSNPTPKGTLLREIAFSDPASEVIYLARPCQFIKDASCRKEYWTTGRFAPEVISSYCSALQELSGNKKSLTLIGYSGGAMIAGLAAVKCPALNIRKVITIAGNLDHREWTSFHGDTPLVHSLNLADFRNDFSRLPQHHFIGEKDDIIPPMLSKKAITDQSTITVISKADHASGWHKSFPAIHNE